MTNENTARDLLRKLQNDAPPYLSNDIDKIIALLNTPAQQDDALAGQIRRENRIAAIHREMARLLNVEIGGGPLDGEPSSFDLPERLLAALEAHPPATDAGEARRLQLADMIVAHFESRDTQPAKDFHSHICVVLRPLIDEYAALSARPESTT